MLKATRRNRLQPGAHSDEYAVLLDEPVPIDLEAKMMDLLNSRMKLFLASLYLEQALLLALMEEPSPGC
jgi:hypothetical protein